MSPVLEVIWAAYSWATRALARASEEMLAKGDELLHHTGLLASPDALQSFPQFSKLPIELRCQIWRHAFPLSRIIELKDGPAHSGRLRAQIFVPWVSSAHPPSVLSVCRESREEALKHYQLAFARNGFPPQIYVNFARDIVFLRHEAEAGCTKDFEKIQYLVVMPTPFLEMWRMGVWKTGLFRNLKEIFVVTKPLGRSSRIGPSTQLLEINELEIQEAVAFYKMEMEEQKDGFLGEAVPDLKAVAFV